MTHLSNPDASAVAAALTDAWNAYDAAAFARQFTEDADFINIFGMHDVGREAIARNHQAIFDGIYRDSTNAFAVTKVRSLGTDAMVAHVAAELTVSHGPMAGGLQSLALAVLVRDGGTWRISSFQNTRRHAPPELGPPD